MTYFCDKNYTDIFQYLTSEEMEAIELKDYDKFEQTKASGKMKTSQSTYHRIFSSARAKIAEAIVEGKALRIEE